MIKNLTIAFATVALLSANSSGKVLIKEDFSKFSAGTEDAPDKTSLTSAKTDPRWVIPSEYTNQSGWTSYYVFQAGGIAYLPKEKPTDDLAPSINTPKLDLSVDGGVFRVKFRARLKDAKITSDRLYVSTSTVSSNFELVAMTDEWQDYDVVLANGTKDCSLQFWTLEKGDFMIDDIEVSTGGGLPTPTDCVSENYDRKSFTASWSAVEGATSYELSVFCFPYGNAQRVYLDGFKEKEVIGTSCFVDGLEPDETYWFMVRAKNAEAKSALTKATKVRIAKLDAPVALTATNITNTGFSANWNLVNLAQGYYVDLYVEHKATTDGKFYLLDTDFSKVDKGTLEEPVTYDGQLPLDQYLDRSGWYVKNAALAAGYVGTDNTYAYYTGESYITSPEYDCSVDGGKTTVEFSVLNPSATPTKVVLEYDTYDENGLLVPIKESQQVVDVPAGESKHTVTLEGGVKECRILILPDVTSYSQLFFDELHVSQMLKAGESILVGVGSKTVYNDISSCDFEVEPAKQGGRYAYTVSAFHLGDTEEENVVSEPSNMVYVDINGSVDDAISGSAVKAYASSGVLHIDNADGENVEVFNVSGSLVCCKRNVSGNIEIALPARGLYVVKAGSATFKIAL